MRTLKCGENVSPVLKTIHKAVLAFCLAINMTVVLAAPDDKRCQTPVAWIVSLQGVVEYHRSGDSGWYPAASDSTFCAGDKVRVRANSRAALRLSNESMLRLDQRTAITIEGPDIEQNTLLDLMNGVMHIITRTPKPFKIRTPVVNASVEGTEFLVDTSQESNRSPRVLIAVYEGTVNATNPQGSLVLTSQEAAIIDEHQPPRKEIMIQPLDAVQWALHYPTLIDYRADANQVSLLPPEIRNAISYYQQGKLTEALAKLDHLTAEEHTAATLIYRASLLLTVGRVQAAQSDLQQALQREPGNSDALALQAITAVVQNRKEDALNLANQAVEQNPASPVARLALSYAQQAHFQIEAALASAEEATRLDPQHALAWARLTELQMSIGYPDRALQSAKRAASLNPNLSRTQTVLGVAHLLQVDTGRAQAAFTRAIALDQADPMPRLGMGIARIRENKLEAGRIDIETAASLDPANSLIRSYLGKAYFEEKRYPLATTQFDLAKARDPNDPTPWLYDAIQKQTQNRPVEALHDIQKSIELNDNRAVYRSQLLLDQDEAARGSSLARIYDNLGFEKRALMETAKSLSFDPSSHSAHRFLSDAYANIPRHEIARVSELLQAQLLQPINVNPVQPRMAVADLNLITGTGPSALGFNEFAPLMERNKAQLVASGIYGSHGTRGDEIVLSGVYDRASVSLGQFHYQTDGFRPNNDQKHNIYNAFMQYALTPKLNIQTELRRRETEHGDLLMDFDRRSFDPDKRRKLEQDTARIGARYALASNQDLLVSAQYMNGQEDQQIVTRQPLPIIPGENTTTIERNHTDKNKAFQAEAQYLFRGENFNFVAGGGNFQNWVNDQIQTTVTLTSQLPPQMLSPIIDLLKQSIGPDTNTNSKRERTNGYLYTNINYAGSTDVTLGVSYDAYEEYGAKFDSLNPKLGLQWNIAKNLRLRLAWFKTIKSALIANQSLEPTQVAGFNQMFDDINGTKATRAGAGLDLRLMQNIYAGLEASARNLRVPSNLSISQETFSIQRQEEELYRAYLYWIPDTRWAVRAEPQFEKFSRSEKEIVINSPADIDTFSVPVGFNYFNPSGFFTKLTGTYVWQDINRKSPATNSAVLQNKRSNFFLLDAAMGFRLPKRRGLLSIEARNLLDEKFSFRHVNFYESEATTSRFIPGRTIFARLTLNF